MVTCNLLYFSLIRNTYNQLLTKSYSDIVRYLISDRNIRFANEYNKYVQPPTTDKYLFYI